jgi:poly-gamma-glutamate synthesis protein (capsule biosynthesis protein)
MPTAAESLRLFLGGDVMTGRGIDQVLRRPCDPRLFEAFVHDARDYLHLAEHANGPIPRPVTPDYVWGEALEVFEEFAPQARIVNLETAVTTHPTPWPRKGINYRMHPDNADCLPAGGLNCCVLANNHVLDWQRDGLSDTLATLDRLGIARCGAGVSHDEAAAPAVLKLGTGRVLVFAFAHPSSGVPPQWRASREQPGVNLLENLTVDGAAAIGRHIAARRRPGDRVIVSLHWGDNWGHAVPDEHRDFARALIEQAGVDLIHGHSSHHPRPIEVHRGRLILYGCGDLINDYEGIRGHEIFRPSLVAMYFPRLDGIRGELLSLDIVPLRIRRFRLERADPEDARWLANSMSRESKAFGSLLTLCDNRRLRLEWT